jgi:hypothetical protein
MDWDAANRQARLQRWIRQNGVDTFWFDEIPNSEPTDLDAWAKRTVRISIGRLNVRIREERAARETPQGKVQLLLEELSESLENQSFDEATQIAMKILNLVATSSLSTFNNSLRKHILETLSLLLIATGDAVN